MNPGEAGGGGAEPRAATRATRPEVDPAATSRGSPPVGRLREGEPSLRACPAALATVMSYPAFRYVRRLTYRGAGWEPRGLGSSPPDDPR